MSSPEVRAASRAGAWLLLIALVALRSLRLSEARATPARTPGPAGATLVVEMADPGAAAAIVRLGGITSARPLFREPPRGWRDPIAARARGLASFLVVELDAAQDAARVERVLAGLPGVRRVFPPSRGVAASTTPDDPSFPQQWALQSGFLDAPDAWDHGTGTTTPVAVIDSGAILTHPELVDNLWVNPGEIPNNGIDDDGNGYVDDVNGWDFVHDDNVPDDLAGHGTHVNGIVGARGNNSLECAGVCWTVPLMELKVWETSGADLNAVNASAAILYAADMGANVLQMAWGFFTPDPTLEAAVLYAADLDCTQVSVAGNFGSETVLWPAAWDQALGIIATDVNDQRASFSSFGRWNDLSAPGADILTISTRGREHRVNGTSFASAHTSGAAALVRTMNRALDRVDMDLLLEGSSVDLGQRGFDGDFGWGRLDLNAAVLRSLSLVVDRTHASAGDDVSITLSLPTEPGFLYAILPSRAGRAPGISLSQYDPSDARVVPVNPDPLLFSFLFEHRFDAAQFFEGFIGALDASGQAKATFHVPRWFPALAEDLSFAAVTFDPADVSHVAGITCSSRVRLK